MNLLDMPEDIIGLIFSPQYIKKLGCTVASRVCKKLNGVVIRRTLKKGVACAEAAFHGQEAVLWWLRDNGCKLKPEALKAAARGGHTDIIRKLFDAGAGPLTYVLCLHAAGGGHLDTLQWLIARGCSWDRYTCERAVKNNHPLMIANLRSPLGYIWNTCMCNMAAKTGRIDMIKLLHQNGCALDDWTFANAIFSNNLELIQWVYDAGCTFDHNKSIYSRIYRMNQDVKDWLQAKGLYYRYG